MPDLIIPDSVYPYLRVQKGEINHIEDRAEFERAYNDGLQKQFDVIKPFLPEILGASLDIGSGMAGIDILLQKEFNNFVALIDAEETPPICTKHDVPFNSKNITFEFFRANNAKLWGYFPAEDINLKNDPVNPFKADLIHSVGSYCFHYSPEKYLQLVKQSCHEKTVLIFDVRNRHVDWLELLRDNFDEVAAIWAEEKFTKRVFKVRI